MNPIWHIMLTVCLDTQMMQCLQQDVQWFETEQQCHNSLSLYSELPVDGPWSVVEYQCKPVGSKST